MTSSFQASGPLHGPVAAMLLSPAKKLLLILPCSLLLVFVVYALASSPASGVWNLGPARGGLQQPDVIRIEDRERDLDWRIRAFRANVTFTAPSAYPASGAVVEGWPPSRDRNVSLYVRPGEDLAVLDMSCLDLSRVSVLIVVQSAPSQFERRQADRRTWMRHQRDFPYVKTVFLFGQEKTGHEDRDAEVQKKVLIEQARFCDLAQMDFVDSYNNVTLDTVLAVKFALTAAEAPRSPGGPDFLVVADDDSYINVPALWTYLMVERGVNKTSPVLVGHRFSGPALFPPPGSRHALYAQTPTYMYSLSVYPAYLSGGGYVLPRATLKCLYEQALATPYFHVNDIFLTGFAALRCGFERRNHPSFHGVQMSPARAKLTDILIHYCDSWCKVTLHSILAERNGSLEPCLPRSFCLQRGLLYYCRESPDDCVRA